MKYLMNTLCYYIDFNNCRAFFSRIILEIG